jgi:hypothetical protein
MQTEVQEIICDLDKLINQSMMNDINSQDSSNTIKIVIEKITTLKKNHKQWSKNKRLIQEKMKVLEHVIMMKMMECSNVSFVKIKM